MSRIAVKPGQKISRATIIGYVGNTGSFTGPHLHYEVHKNGIARESHQFLLQRPEPEEYEKMVEISSRASQSLIKGGRQKRMIASRRRKIHPLGYSPPAC
jgi:murein DD-endopeptidase MepM/ murein hydrolase activator NlpD